MGTRALSRPVLEPMVRHSDLLTLDLSRVLGVAFVVRGKLRGEDCKDFGLFVTPSAAALLFAREP